MVRKSLLIAILAMTATAQAAVDCRSLVDGAGHGELSSAAHAAKKQPKGLVAKMANWLKGEGKVSLLAEPVAINGIDAYPVDLEHSSLENELVRAERVLSKKNGGHVFLQSDFLESQEMHGGFATLLKVKDGKHIPAAVFRKAIAKHPLQWAGVIWHEVTHAGNLADALKGIDVARLRTFTFRVPKGSEYRLPIEGYEGEFRIDEIHAQTVEVGILLRQMRQAMADADYALARKLEREVAFRNTYVSSFAKESDRQIAVLRKLLRDNPQNLKLTRIGAGNATVLHVDYELPFYSEEGLGVANLMLRRLTRLQFANAQAPMRLTLLMDPGVAPENHLSYLADFLDRGQRDYRRFSKTLSHFGERMTEILSPLN